MRIKTRPIGRGARVWYSPEGECGVYGRRGNWQVFFVEELHYRRLRDAVRAAMARNKRDTAH